MAYDFHYTRSSTGELSGLSLATQTELALTELGVRVDTAEDDIDTLETAVSVATANASEALSAANAAQTTADTATALAKAAQASADEAQETAETAQTTADTATELAKAAQTTADEATEKAEAAAEAASTAQSTADAAQTAITTLEETVDGKADIYHASESTDYGTGTETLYGHVQLSDSIDSTSDAGGGIAATPYAVYQVNDLADTALDAADSAQTAANTALSTATDAASAAEEAQTVAESAQTDATSALESATEALESAYSVRTAKQYTETTSTDDGETTEAAAIDADALVYPGLYEVDSEQDNSNLPVDNDGQLEVLDDETDSYIVQHFTDADTATVYTRVAIVSTGETTVDNIVTPGTDDSYWEETETEATDEYSETATYAEGDLVIYDSVYYICLLANGPDAETTTVYSYAWGNWTSGNYVPLSGLAGEVSYYETVGTDTTITEDSPASIETADAVTISNGTSGTAWTKVIHLTGDTPTITAGSGWTWSNGETPTLETGCFVVACWCGSAGILTYHLIG